VIKIRDLLHFDSTIRAVDSSWAIVELNGNSQQRDMAPKPLFDIIVWLKSLTTDIAG
jgi:hypothetical protein